MSEKTKCNYGKELTKGFLKENPVLRLVLGTCPTLATSTSVVNGVGMGIAATIVLICSNAAISALRKVIPEKARIPAYIVIIASFVTMVQMLVKAFVPALDKSLGVFLPLIVVNCIILGRAEAFASKNPVLASAVDGLGMGIGFTAALFCMGTVREILGAGTFLSGIDTMLGAYVDLGSFTGFDFTEELSHIGLVPMTIFILPAGGFFVFGLLMALANKLAESKGLKTADSMGCSGCPHAAFCGKLNGNETSASDTDVKAENVQNVQCKSEKATEETQNQEVKTETQKEAEEKTETSTDTDTQTSEAETTQAKEEKSEETDEIKTVQTEKQSGNSKKQKSKNKKNRQKETIKEAFDTPIPETIPSFLKKESNETENKEDNEQ